MPYPQEWRPDGRSDLLPAATSLHSRDLASTERARHQIATSRFYVLEIVQWPVTRLACPDTSGGNIKSMSIWLSRSALL